MAEIGIAFSEAPPQRIGPHLSAHAGAILFHHVGIDVALHSDRIVTLLLADEGKLTT